MKQKQATRAQAPKPWQDSFDPDAAAGKNSGIYGLPCSVEEARVVVLPVPWEATCSYGGGTARGPRAVFLASKQVDLQDLQTGCPWQHGIAMLPIAQSWVRQNHRARIMAQPVIAAGGRIKGNSRLEQHLDQVNAFCAQMNGQVYDVVMQLLKNRQMVFTLGGDHSVPLGAIQAYQNTPGPSFGILHLDAHCDLRVAYEGFTYSHASIMYNVLQQTNVSKLVQVGIRDASAKEIKMAQSWDRIKLVGSFRLFEELAQGRSWHDICQEIASELPQYVYLSFDIDGLDPAYCPHTGTPVPGGLSFEQVVYLLKVVQESGRTIIGGDLCEVTPGPRGDEWDANVGARLLYKMIGFALRSQR